MNTIDSIEMNEDLVIIWNGIEERTQDLEVKQYAKNKVKQLSDLRESKRISDNNKKEFDKAYMLLIEKEIREVKKYAWNNSANNNHNVYSIVCFNTNINRRYFILDYWKRKEKEKERWVKKKRKQ